MSNRRRTAPCIVPACPKPVEAGGLCSLHRSRVRRGKAVDDEGRGYARSWRQRFIETGWTVNEYGCWLWKGTCNNSGYGKVSAHGEPNGIIGAHVAAWRLWTGLNVPNGMDVCHSCTFRSCVNPRHLRVDTSSENMRDRQRIIDGVLMMMCGRSALPGDLVRARVRVDTVGES